MGLPGSGSYLYIALEMATPQLSTYPYLELGLTSDIEDLPFDISKFTLIIDYWTLNIELST